MLRQWAASLDDYVGVEFAASPAAVAATLAIHKDLSDRISFVSPANGEGG